MSLDELQHKISAYRERDRVKVTERPFERLCKLLAPSKAAAVQVAPEAARCVSAKLFAIISQQGKTSAATALFQSRRQVEELASVPWEDIDWYVTHPARASVSGMYSNGGFPDRAAVEALEEWVLKAVGPEKFKSVFSSITGMQAHRGPPGTKTSPG